MKKNVVILPVLALWVALTLWVWLAPPKALSVAERRPLKQRPEFTVQTLLDGSYTERFAEYSLDQFPARDTFRTVKAMFSLGVLGQRDNNGIYIEKGYAGKLEYPLHSQSLSYVFKKLNSIYDMYLKDTDSQIYMAVIPDKGYYLTQENGYPAMDYEALFAQVTEQMPWAQIVDITKDLTVSDYYRTDTHWRQEKLQAVAKSLCVAMGSTLLNPEEATVTLATNQFYGVYYGQSALPLKPESLYILESNLLKSCRVYNHETGTYGSVYDWEKLQGADPYEVYLSGAQALLTVENPNAATDRELVLFRDSFGSSLAPWLIQGYQKVTLVDIRYVSSDILDQYLSFEGQDVLFLYSTLILNNSTVLK